MELDNELWDQYLRDCGKKGVQPDVSDFKVWLQEQDYDEDEVEREASDVA